MTKRKLLDDILQNPARIYRSPGDVLRDRRFADVERLEILRAWLATQTESADIAAIILELEARLFDARGHAAE